MRLDSATLTGTWGPRHVVSVVERRWLNGSHSRNTLMELV